MRLRDRSALPIVLALAALPAGPILSLAAAGPAALAPAAVRGAGASLSAQEGPPEEPEEPGEPEAARDTVEDEDGVQPYEEVVTGEAVTDSGLFVTHLVDGDLYYEIPRSELDRPDLWVSRIARAQQGAGFGGLKTSSRVVRWTYRPGDETVLLRDVSYEVVADSTTSVYRSVRNSTFEPVIMAFDVEAFGPDSALVVEVTDLFTSDVAEFSPKELINAASLERDRSFLEEVLAFPENIEVRALLTFLPKPESEEGGFFVQGTGASTISLVMHHSMIRLPADLMQPRLADDRVGFFEVQQYDYSLPEHESPRRRMVTRWRLECPAGEAPPCEPVEPIVFYVGPGTPEKWKPYIKQGIEDWREAFREAGFRNAIEGRYPPSEAEDPEWHPEDARYSVVRWTASTIPNAFGPHVHDPRTGEILEADIHMFHNVMSLTRDWYFTQVAPLDERASSLPLPDSLMGETLRYVAAHEVGHSLGFPHNMKASSGFPVDSLRSASFTRKHGDEASIMDYGRFNYVAQPGDGVRLIPKIGPYDEFAVEWGYRPLEGGPEEERAALNDIARRQEENPWLLFGSADGIDPSAQTEDLGSDPVAATRLGLRNLERVMDMLLDATTREGDSYEDLEHLYGRVVGQWAREMGHVVTLVGGVYQTRKVAGQEGVVHEPVPADRQREAMAFLHEHAFRPPAFLVDPDVLRRFEPTGTVERVRDEQADLIRELLLDARLHRLVEHEAVRSGPEPYPLEEMLADLRRGVWSELERRGDVVVGPYRRNLQREWTAAMIEKLDNRSDVGALARSELRDLADRIEDRVDDADDRATRAHLRDTAERVRRALDPREE